MIMTVLHFRPCVFLKIPNLTADGEITNATRGCGALKSVVLNMAAPMCHRLLIEGRKDEANHENTSPKDLDGSRKMWLN